MGPRSVEEMRVLVVDDNADLVDIIGEFLEREHDGITTLTATSGANALALLETETVDCLVSDYDMPEMDGLELLREVREIWPDLPFVLFTGKGSEEIASEAISASVTEYLQKETAPEQYTLLANRVERAVSERRAEARQAETERRFSTLVETLPGMVYRCRNEQGWPMEFLSDGCEELTGYTAEQLESGAVDWGAEVLHPDDREEMWETVQRMKAESDTFQVTYRIRQADGEIRWCRERGQFVDSPEDDGGVLIEGYVTDITPRKRREQELRAEREFTEGALNAVEDLFLVVDPETEQLLRWNDRVPERTGYTDSELAAMQVGDLVAADHRRRVGKQMSTTDTADAITVEADIVTAAGDRIAHEFRGTIIDGEYGHRLASIGRDISGQRSREQRLEQYRTLVENVGDPMYALDTEGTIEVVNSAMVDQLGYDREEIVGMPSSVFLPEETNERAREVVTSLIGSDRKWETWEMEVETGGGDITSHENKTAILTDDDGRFAGSVGVIREITDRKKREQELERYETVVEAVGDPVYALDDDGVITFVNDAIEEMTGYDPESVIGNHIRSIAADEGIDTGRQEIQALLDDPTERATTFEIDVETDDGEYVPSELHIALLPMDDGTFRGTAGIIRDIADRKEREKRLEEFASVVSHDLRGPLNVIAGRVELAKKKSDIAELDSIEEAVTRMDGLIEDLLTLARQGQTVGDLEQVSLSSVADRAWYSVDAPDATLDSWVTLSVDADPERLQELLENLFSNAVQHGGEDVSITVGRLEDAPGFYVADDGPGIPAAAREDVFDHGYTTNERGTGFGLSIVERIADAHGWSIRADESKDGGARFEVRTE